MVVEPRYSPVITPSDSFQTEGLGERLLSDWVV